MAQINQVTFAGYVGKDAEDRTLPGGQTRVVSFSMCHTEKGKNGREDVSTWVRVKVFGAWCDTAAQVKKGDNVLVMGKLQVQNYKGKDGSEKTSVDLLAHTLGVLQKTPPPQSKAASGAMPEEDIPF